MVVIKCLGKWIGFIILWEFCSFIFSASDVTIEECALLLFKETEDEFCMVFAEEVYLVLDSAIVAELSCGSTCREVEM